MSQPATTPPTSTPTPRLIARLIAAIYAIAATLRPVIDAIAQHSGPHPAASWHHRARLATRFSTILQNLLALTAQIGPATLTPRPERTPSPRTPQTDRTTPRQTLIRTPRRAPPLSPRQLARRLAALLAQLLALAAEAGAILPAALHHHIATARRLARCNPHPTWERAG